MIPVSYDIPCYRPSRIFANTNAMEFLGSSVFSPSRLLNRKSLKENSRLVVSELHVRHVMFTMTTVIPTFSASSHCKHVVQITCLLTIDGIVYIGNQIVIHCQQHLNTSILFSSFFYFQSALSHTLHLPLPREQTALDYTSGLYTPGTMTYFRFSMTRREDAGCLSRY